MAHLIRGKLNNDSAATPLNKDEGTSNELSEQFYTTTSAKSITFLQDFDF
jgi:hypothetical protein